MKALPLALVTLLALTGCNMLAVPFTVDLSNSIDPQFKQGSAQLPAGEYEEVRLFLPDAQGYALPLSGVQGQIVSAQLEVGGSLSHTGSNLPGTLVLEARLKNNRGQEAVIFSSLWELKNAQAPLQLNHNVERAALEMLNQRNATFYIRLTPKTRLERPITISYQINRLIVRGSGRL